MKRGYELKAIGITFIIIALFNEIMLELGGILVLIGSAINIIYLIKQYIKIRSK
jgi:hypothetical protein